MQESHLADRNYAFIDGQNMHKGTMKQGWLLLIMAS